MTLEPHVTTYLIEDTLPPYEHWFRLLEEDKIKKFQEVPKLINLSEIENVANWLEDEANVYIGRKSNGLEASPWQNPYSTRKFDICTALKNYKQHVMQTPALIENIGILRDKNLGCFCADGNFCHGKVLLNILDPPEPW